MGAHEDRLARVVIEPLPVEIEADDARAGRGRLHVADGQREEHGAIITRWHCGARAARF